MRSAHFLRSRASWFEVAPNLYEGASPWPTITYFEAWRAPAQPRARLWPVGRPARSQRARPHPPSKRRLDAPSNQVKGEFQREIDAKENRFVHTPSYARTHARSLVRSTALPLHYTLLYYTILYYTILYCKLFYTIL